MPFNGYLAVVELLELRQAALDSNLLEVSRAVLMSGIPVAFVAGLPVRPAPSDQFANDLVEINRVERMEGGLVPLDRLLENIAMELKLRGRAEARVFERMQSRVANLAAGVRIPLPVATLPEIKEAIIGEDEMVDISFLKRGLELGEAVARILVPRFDGGTRTQANGGPWIMKGTAWLVAPNLAMTNHHVINARRYGEAPASSSDFTSQGRNASLEFGFDARDATIQGSGVTSVVSSSEDLDYALLELTSPPRRLIPRLRAKRVVHTATTRLAVNIIQHPHGDTKRVALRNNLVTSADDDTIRYFTDTDYGSSGSPVCDDEWRVVALHRGAEQATNVTYLGKPTAYVNFGSQIQAIIEHMEHVVPAAAAKIAAAQVS
jgi:V8-like Glu-specific endopeptidase